jgi:hypothetical protein
MIYVKTNHNWLRDQAWESESLGRYSIGYTVCYESSGRGLVSLGRYLYSIIGYTVYVRLDLKKNSSFVF